MNDEILDGIIDDLRSEIHELRDDLDRERERSGQPPLLGIDLFNTK